MLPQVCETKSKASGKGIPAEKVVARVLEKKVKNEEKEESEYRNDLSKDNYIKFT